MRRDISESNLDAFLAEHAMAVLLFQEPGEFSQAALAELASVCERAATRTALASVEGAGTSALRAMFGVTQTPYLVILRERIALFAEPVRPTPVGLKSVLSQIQQLDMARVRADIEAERQAREALLMRRACPTRTSGPARSRE